MNATVHPDPPPLFAEEVGGFFDVIAACHRPLSSLLRPLQRPCCLNGNCVAQCALI
jgi:hypothetical protein